MRAPGALLVAAAVRLALLLQHPTIAPDGPAYVHLAPRLATRGWTHALDAYYPPLLPLLMEVVHRATIIPHELAARLISLLAGLGTIVLLGRFTTTVLGRAAGLLAMLVGAVHAHLARASIAVLPEMLFGAFVASWASLVCLPGTALRLVVGAVVAASAGLVRVEGLALAPLTVVAPIVTAPRGDRARRVLLVLATIAAIARKAVHTSSVWLLKASREPLNLPAGVRHVGTLCGGRTQLLVYEPNSFRS